MTNEAIEKNCPEAGVLVDFLQGKLVPPELEKCESHLEDCDVCQETLSGINASDTLSEVVAKAMGPHTPSADDAEVVQNLVRRLGKPAGFSTTRNDISNPELLRDRAAEVLLHVAPDPEDELSLGLLAGFRLRELLGSGGTGVVFRAYDLALDREIALKVLRPSLGDLARDRFVAEARAAASIDHENVVAIHQVGEQKRLAWIAMKWVPGETLESRLVREGSLSEIEVRQLSVQIAKGLAEAHRQQLVHRDIKLANVWIGEADGKVLILDFGLVRITDNDPALTATGMLAGTPNFMSPEQAKGQELDARSDLFSLGCVMYQMITGTLPFGSPTILATLQSIQTQQPETPILFADDCSEELSDLTMALLEKQPANRVDSAESLVHCLETPRSDWSADMKRRMAAKREQTDSTLKPLATTHGSRFGAGTLIGALLLGLFGFGLWFFAPQIIRIATNQGELVIETDDENVKVTVSENGEDIRVLDTSSGASFDIRSGEFEISATGKDGKIAFDVVPNQLTMERGGRENVRVTRMPKAITSENQTLEEQSTDILNQKNFGQGAFEDESFLGLPEIDSETIVLIRGDKSNAFVAFSKTAKTWSTHKFAEYLAIQPRTLFESLPHNKNDLVVSFEYKGGPVTELVAVDCLGKFCVRKLNPALNSDLIPILNGDGVIYYINDEIVYAFSGKTGTWDTYKVPGLPDVDWRNGAGHVPSELDTESEKGIVIKRPTGTAKFLAETGKWQFVPNQGESQRVFEGHNFNKWLQIAKTGKQADVRSRAIAACVSLIEYDQQFDQVAQFLGELAKSTTSAKTQDGSTKLPLRMSLFFQGLSKLSAKQLCEFLELQLKNGDDQTVVNTLEALDEWGDVENHSEKELVDEIKPKAAGLLRLVSLREKPLPSVCNKFIDVLKSLNDKDDDQVANAKVQQLYRGEQLGHWLQVLETDLDAQTQAKALRACAALYLSEDQEDELVALLQSYIERNANLFQGEEMTTCFLGFEDSLRKLPANKIADFFKLQLKQGTTTSIDWAYRGMTYSRLPPEINRRVLAANARRPTQAASTEANYRRRYIGKPVSKELREQLESDAVELLRLIAARDIGDDIGYLSNSVADRLLRFVASRLLKDSVSDEAIGSFKKILTKLDVNELSEALDVIPSNMLTAELFSQLFARSISRNDQYELIYTLLIKEPVSDEAIAWIKEIIPKLDAGEQLHLLKAMPRHIHIPEFFVAAKDRLFAGVTSEYDRTKSIYNLVLLEGTTDEQTTLILETFAEVVAKQLDARDSLDFYVSDHFWRYWGSKETSGRAVVARKLLSIICEQIIDPKTLLSLRSEIDGSSDRRATYSSTGRSNSETRALESYVDEFFKKYDADDNGIIEGDEIERVRNNSKYDTNNDGKIKKDEMLAVIAGPILITLSSSQSRNKAAKLAKKVLAILAKPSSSEQVVDPTVLADFKKLQIDHDIEALKKISKKQSGEFSRFIDIDKRKFQGDPEVTPTREPKEEVAPPLIPSGEGN